MSPKMAVNVDSEEQTMSTSSQVQSATNRGNQSTASSFVPGKSMQEIRSRKRQTVFQPQYYEGPFEIESKDLELMEERISELERYLGIEDMDLAYFNSQEGEDLYKKSQMLEDFMYVAHESYSCIKDIFQKFEKMEYFLKNQELFTDQC